jgi:hypothetical protein
MKFMPLSNDTVSKGISVTSNDMHEQMLQRILKIPKLTIQLDESTDILNSEQLTTYVLYCFEKHGHKSCEFVSHCKDELQVKSFVNVFLIAEKLPWNKRVVCTNGVARMISKKKGSRL